MSLRSFAGALALLCLCEGAVAAPAPPVAHAEPAAEGSANLNALGLELAEAAQPRALLLEAAVAGFDHGFKTEMQNEGFEEIEKEFPGYMAKLQQRGRVEMARMIDEQIPAMHGQLAKIYAAELTEREMRGMIDFYRTPTGRKLLRQMALTPSTDDSTDDFELTAEELAKTDRAAGLRAIREMNAAEKLDLMKFGMSPAGLASRRVEDKLLSVVAENMNQIMAKFPDRFAPIAVEILESYSTSDR